MIDTGRFSSLWKVLPPRPGLVLLGGLQKQGKQVLFPTFEISFNCAWIILLILSKHPYQHQNQFSSFVLYWKYYSNGLQFNFSELALCGKQSPPHPQESTSWCSKNVRQWLVSYLQSSWRRLGGEDFSGSGLFWNMIAGEMGWGWVRKCDREENGAQMSPGCYCGQLQDHRKMCLSVIPLHSVGSQLLVSVSHRLLLGSVSPISHLRRCRRIWNQGMGVSSWRYVKKRWCVRRLGQDKNFCHRQEFSWGGSYTFIK